MARLTISEYEDPKASPTFPMQVPYEDGNNNGKDQPLIDFGDNASHFSQPFAAGTKMIQVSTDTKCHIVFGKNNPVANQNGKMLAAGVTLCFAVQVGAGLQLAVITDQ